MPTLQPTKYEPFPTDDWLILQITSAEFKDSFFRDNEEVIDFTIKVADGPFKGRTVWRNFDKKSWPEEGQKDTKLFAFIRDFAPDQAIKGQPLDTDMVINRKARGMMEDYLVKSGEHKGETRQKLGRTAPLKPGSVVASNSPVAEGEPAVASVGLDL